MEDLVSQLISGDIIIVNGIIKYKIKKEPRVAKRIKVLKINNNFFHTT
jgi:hypothetical protein